MKRSMLYEAGCDIQNLKYLEAKKVLNFNSIRLVTIMWQCWKWSDESMAPTNCLLSDQCCGGRVMKMGKVAHRVGIEPTSLAFHTSVLTMTSSRLPDVTTYPRLPVCVVLCLTITVGYLRHQHMMWFAIGLSHLSCRVLTIDLESMCQTDCLFEYSCQSLMPFVMSFKRQSFMFIGQVFRLDLCNVCTA